MTLRFVIEDQIHAEMVAEFDDEASAIQEVRRLFALPWDALPNRAPCGNSPTCGREYELQVFDTATTPWRLVRSQAALNVSAEGAELLISDRENLK